MITVNDLNGTYGNTAAITNINFTIPNPGIHGIIGPNGSGKSTLMKALVGLHPAANIRKNGQRTRGNNGQPSATVLLDGHAPGQVRKQIAYIAQRSDLDMNFPTNVLDTVLMGTYPSLGLLRRPTATHRAAAKKALEAVDMWEFHSRHISELSGGQFQRILFARAIVQDAKFVFLDEPFVGIDRPSERLIMEQLRTLADGGAHVFIVHHDLNTVTDYFDDLLMMNQRLVAAGPTDQVFVPDNLKQAFGALIIESATA